MQEPIRHAKYFFVCNRRYEAGTDIIKQAIREAIATCSKEDMAIAKICPHCEEDKNEEWGAD